MIPEYRFSIYKAPISNTIPVKKITLEEIARLISGDKYKSITDEIQNSSNKEQQNKLKAKYLDYVTFSGVFSKRSRNGLIVHSNLICIDIDNLKDLNQIKEKLTSILPPVLMFTSPSGKGLKIVYKIVITENVTHDKYFKALLNFLNKKLKIEIDQGCKDIPRACFLCHDPNVYFNTESEILNETFVNDILKSKSYELLRSSEQMDYMKELLNKKMKFQSGNRNNYIANLAGAFNRKDIPKDIALDYLLNFSESGFSENEIERIFNSIYGKKEWNGVANLGHDFKNILLSASNHIDSIKDFIMPNARATSLILERLLNVIIPIDFRDYANLFDEKSKLLKKHYLVSVVEILIDKSKEHEFDLCRKNGEIFLFNSQYWANIDQDVFKDFLGEVALKMGVQKFDAKLHTFKDELYKQFLTDAGLKEIIPKTDTTLINLKNGTFEISPKNQTLREFRQSDFITYQLPFEYDESANAPKFKTFLDQVLPDLALQDILSEYLGYVFIKGSVLKLEKVLLLYGTGANGKSVMFDIINAILGSENTTSYSLQSLTDDKGYSRAEIANKLLNYASEINGKLEASLFKQLASGEPVSARSPYGRPYIVNDYAKLMFNCNELPIMVENTNAFFRRFIIIPFKVTIPEDEQDKELSKKIINTELSGVFNWILEGLQRLLKNKSFTNSNLISEEITQFRKESDSVLMFLEEYKYVKSITKRKDRKIIYDEYKYYCFEFGNRPLSAGKFYKRLRSKDFEEESSNGVRYFNIEVRK